MALRADLWSWSSLGRTNTSRTARSSLFVESLPNVHLTVTPALDHTGPSASLKNFGSFLRFCRFVVRGLATAASRREPFTDAVP